MVSLFSLLFLIGYGYTSCTACSQHTSESFCVNLTNSKGHPPADHPQVLVIFGYNVHLKTLRKDEKTLKISGQYLMFFKIFRKSIMAA